MTDQMQTLRDDLAFLREMAAEGGRASPQGGVILACAGFIFGAASLAAWAILSGELGVGPGAVWIPWLASAALFYTILFFAPRGIKREARGSTASRLAGVAWSALGGAMFTIIVSAVAIGTITGSNLVWVMVPSVFMAIFGAGWTVAAAASGQGWMRLVALGSFAAAILVGCLARTQAVWLAYGVALMLLAGVPGLVLMRRRPE